MDSSDELLVHSFTILAIKGHTDILQRIFSASKSADSAKWKDTFLSPTSLEGMLTLNDILKGYAKSLDFGRWPHSVLLSEAAKVDTFDQFEKLLDSIQKTTELADIAACLAKVIDTLPSGFITILIPKLLADSGPDLNQGVLLSYAAKTVIARQIHLASPIESLVRSIFEIFEIFRKKTQSYYAVSWIKKDEPWLRPLMAYAIGMAIFSSCLDTDQLLAEKQYAQRVALDTFYRESNNIHTWDRKFELALMLFVQGLGNSKLIEETLVAFDQLNQGWNLTQTD